jgi:hypothetical protein
VTPAIAAFKGRKIWAVDFVNAYLKSKMKENVFMAQPEGMQVEGSNVQICQRDFNLYGAMQGASNWWEELVSRHTRRKIHLRTVQKIYYSFGGG